MAVTSAKNQLRFLHLEDNANDQLLVREMLDGEGLLGEMITVTTSNEFERALVEKPFDLIISDFSLPSFDGLKALSLARKISPQTPFIFFSGTIGEEVAVDSLKNGAVDYVLKQRPQRLVVAVHSAIRTKQVSQHLAKVEGELQQMEERLRIVSRATNDVVWEWDIQSGKVWFSENFQTVFGHPREEIGSSLAKWQELIHPDDRERVVSGLASAVAGGGRVWWSEHRLSRVAGSYLEVFDRASVIYNEGRKPIRIVGTVIDITERKQIQARLQISEERARLMVESIRDYAIIMIDPEGYIMTWNEAAQRIKGYTAAEIIGQQIFRFYPRDLVEKGYPQKELAEAAKSGRFEDEGWRVRKDGSQFWASVIVNAIRDKDGRLIGFVKVTRDLTKQRESVQKIREQAELLDKAQDAIIVCDLDRTILYWNKGAERIYGWNVQEAIGKNVRQLFFHGKIPTQITEAVKSLDESGEWMGELSEFTKKDHPVIVQARATIIRDERGYPKSLLIINTDITERKQLEEQLLRAQRLESLGSLVGGIAHDLNNALVPITVGVDILRQQSLSPDAQSMMRTMESSAQRSAEMVKQMLVFARGGEVEKEIIHLERLLNEMGKIVTGTFPKTIRCNFHADKSLRAISGFPTQLHQILLNLCVNARDAMPDGGTLTLTAENVDLPQQEAARHKVSPGQFICLTVGDTGTGIPPKIMEKIFQPFFTTKGNRGTGLGLSTCQSIVKGHGGFIVVQSKPGEGTCFEVYLPAVDGRTPDTSRVRKGPLPAGSGERILVVDDEEAILAIARAALENYGYEVLTANSGVEAVNLFDKHRETINLLISDLEMPLMNGKETVEAIRKLRPDLKVIIISGSEKQIQELMPQIKMDVFVPKPFTNESLLEAVHSVLVKK
jgi:PAS domain S-box-containing protein